MGLRLAALTQSPLDFQATRQFFSALIARAIYVDHFNQVSATTRAVMDQGAPANIEPPISEWMAAIMYWLSGGEHLWMPRLIAATAWVSGGLALFLLMRILVDRRAALVATAFYLLNPFAVVASTSFQPDPAMVAAQVWALLVAVLYHRDPTWPMLILAALTAAVAALLKAPGVFIPVAVFAALSIQRMGLRRGLIDIRLALYVVLAIAPTALWYISRPTTVRSVYFLPGFFLTPGFWAGWLVITSLVVGLLSLVAAIGAVWIFGRGPTRAALLGWTVGYLALVIGFNYRVATHDYYSLPLIPLVAAGLGLLVAGAGGPRRILAAVALVGAASLLLLDLQAGYLHLGPIQADAAQVQNYTDAGDLVGHGPGVIALSPAYGYAFDYYGKVVVSDWPHQVDIDLDSASGLRDIGAGPRLDQLIASTHARWFVVLDMGELDRQPDLKQLLYARYRVARSTSYLAFDVTQR